MRYMIIVKATRESERGVMPSQDLFHAMAQYHEELAKAGVLIDASGLHPSSKGWRVEYDAEKRSIVDGPFAEVKELIAGFTMIKVDSEQDARDWSKRFPNPSIEKSPCHIEVRRIFELDDFEPGEAIDRFKKLEQEQVR